MEKDLIGKLIKNQDTVNVGLLDVMLCGLLVGWIFVCFVGGNIIIIIIWLNFA